MSVLQHGDFITKGMMRDFITKGMMIHSNVFSAVYANDYDYIRSTPAVDDVEVDDTQ